MSKILFVRGWDVIDPPLGLEQDLEGLLEPAGGIATCDGDGVDDPPGRTGLAGAAAHELDLLVGGQDGRSRIPELGLAGGARGVGAGGRPVRNYQGRAEFVDCVRMVHLRRDFQAMIDRKAGGEEVGASLLRSSRFVFAWWRRLESGSVARPTLQSYVAGLKPVVRLQLAEGAACACPRTARVCRELLAREPLLWRFATAAGVPPHNNAAERALRGGVIWRKTSFGTDSAKGSRFVAGVLSVAETCRQRGRDVLSFLTGCTKAQLEGQPAPALLS